MQKQKPKGLFAKYFSFGITNFITKLKQQNNHNS